MNIIQTSARVGSAVPLNNMYNLYSYYRSSCSWRVRLALELKNLPYTLTQINLLENEQLQSTYTDTINPLGVVPALVLDDGQTVLTQSLAILEYLDEIHPEPFPLLPQDALERAHVRQLVQMVVADCQPLQNLHVLRRFKNLANATDEQVSETWARPFIIRALAAYAKSISPNTKFSLGDRVSLADLCLIPQLYNARRFGIQVQTQFPRLHEIESNFQSTYPEAFHRAHPDHSK